MGDILSTPSLSNPSSTAIATSTSAMTSSNSSEAPQSKSETEPSNQPKIPESETPVLETRDPPTDAKTTGSQETPAEDETLSGEASEDSVKEADGDEEGEGEEEEGECGFCLFMKGGGCKDAFIDWEKCVEEGEKNNEDIVEKCFQATAALKKCMEAHSDYYAPLLQAEKAAEEEAVKQLEEEKERSSNQERGGEESEKEEALDGSEKGERLDLIEFCCCL
ncbi:hypothetical protein Salat_1955000 [Sesamum alatum]|uniref:GCK domain-containing protein n=1 Tax=Sesamum alatum TaxID=300844 RepID=A0AAE1Y5T3_9LAMI|nr:hypothetical protein Salat_1955000 [Sesamum alatum]